ncbi:MAG: formate dehydrogenase subunit gamma [Alphaproteobacteria bacterium]|nr:formate dehydrogenase subunit gamma [Alphaproteobacteria bacterium]
MALRIFSILMLTLMVTLAPSAPVLAQEAGTEATQADPRAATGGATTLEDILRRQEGLKYSNEYRAAETGNPDNAKNITDQLGTLGGASDPDLWRALRFDTANVTTQAQGPAVEVLIQDRGMWWLELREGPIATYGGFLMLGTLGALVLFYLFRGKIRIDGPKTGKTILRFESIERFAHWLMAGSFIILGITGLVSLFGRMALIPLFGHEFFSDIAIGSKWIHNNISWAFMLGIVLSFVLWVRHNIPNKTDIAWLAVGGGIFTKGVHPPAKKFNAGQKFIFWSVILLGGSISASGLSLLFPFELPMFAATFEKLNAVGIPQLIGLGELNTALTPHEEMQYAQLWHAIVSFVLMAIIIAHIYIGSVGMEGAFDAMGSGEVEEQWAKEHHGLWVKEVKEQEAQSRGGRTAPAE